MSKPVNLIETKRASRSIEITICFSSSPCLSAFGRLDTLAAAHTPHKRTVRCVCAHTKQEKKYSINDSNESFYCFLFPRIRAFVLRGRVLELDGGLRADEAHAETERREKKMLNPDH